MLWQDRWPRLPRQLEREFWRKVALGLSTEDAAVSVGVSRDVACRWFRNGGGMPTLSLSEPTGIRAVIPEPADQAANRKRRGSAGGRPVAFDAQDYKQRNVVERFFNRLKNWRGLASRRYDKLATVFRGSVVLAAIVDWLR